MVPMAKTIRKLVIVFTFHYLYALLGKLETFPKAILKVTPETIIGKQLQCHKKQLEYKHNAQENNLLNCII